MLPVARLAVAVFVSVAFLGCAGSNASAGKSGGKLDELRTRAAFDLTCAEEELKITDLGGNAIGVSGCNKRATYMEQCGGPGTSWGNLCIWKLNSAVEAPPPE